MISTEHIKEFTLCLNGAIYTLCIFSLCIVLIIYRCPKLSIKFYLELLCYMLSFMVLCDFEFITSIDPYD